MGKQWYIWLILCLNTFVVYGQKVTENVRRPLIGNIGVEVLRGDYYHEERQAVIRIGRTNNVERILYNILYTRTKVSDTNTEVYFTPKTKTSGQFYQQIIDEERKEVIAHIDSVTYENLLTFALEHRNGAGYTIEGNVQYYKIGKLRGRYPYIDLYWEWDGIYYEETEMQLGGIDDSPVWGRIKYRVRKGKKHYHGRLIRYILVDNTILRLSTSGKAKKRKTAPEKVFETVKQEFDVFHKRIYIK